MDANQQPLVSCTSLHDNPNIYVYMYVCVCLCVCVHACLKVYLLKQNNDWNVNFLQNSHLSIQQTISTEFTII